MTAIEPNHPTIRKHTNVMKLEQSATLLETGVSRRSFLKLTSTLAAGTAFAGVFFRVDEA